MAAVEVFTQALASDAPYDLVLMAAHMPAMDGTEAVRQIRAMEKAQGIPRARGVHILMLTSVADAAGVARSPQEAYDGYLLKPVDLGDLLGHLRFFGFAG
jgi:two-component system chemotaxis response regulator CheY